MIERRELPEGVAPSYYLEGLLYNVPADKFVLRGHVRELLQLDPSDSTKLVCASCMHWLVRDNEQTS